MTWRLKSALMASALISLTGCNMVMTTNPMFTKADALGAPPMRLGVWRSDKPGCEFDETLPQNQWPKCAEAEPGIGDPPIWLEVGGDPVLLQLRLPIPYLKNASGAYLYAAFRPLKQDAQGRVIVMKTWPVQCGPPPPPEAKGQVAGPPQSADRKMAGLASLGATRSPLPGLHMDSDTGTCTPEAAAALRDAAKASEAWADGVTTSHWVREFGAGDLPPLSLSSLAKALPN